MRKKTVLVPFMFINFYLYNALTFVTKQLYRHPNIDIFAQVIKSNANCFVQYYYRVCYRNNSLT